MFCLSEVGWILRVADVLILGVLDVPLNPVAPTISRGEHNSYFKGGILVRYARLADFLLAGFWEVLSTISR